jgi:hypothetical protein
MISGCNPRKTEILIFHGNSYQNGKNMDKIPNRFGKEWPQLANADNASFGDRTNHSATQFASFGAKGLKQPSRLLTNHYLFTNHDKL